MNALPSDYTVNVIVGKLTPQLMMFRHEGLAEFGIGNDETEYYWNSLIRQMLLGDLLVKDIEEYGVLKITKKGQEFLKKPRSFEIVLNNAFEEANAEDDEEAAEAAPAIAASDEKLVYDADGTAAEGIKEKRTCLPLYSSWKIPFRIWPLFIRPHRWNWKNARA